MRSVALLVFMMTFGLSTVAATEHPPTSNHADLEALQAAKDAVEHGRSEYGGRVGGDNTSNPYVIPGLPFTDTGNTCAYLDDYYEVCPFEAPGSPEVVYAFTPAGAVQVDLSLCNSYFDTQLYVYDATGLLVACNDDFCSGPNYPYTYLSYIGGLSLSAGNTYYIVVDGYYDDCGDYVLDVSPWSTCVGCPEGALVENEPPVFNYESDIWNGGCNASPPVFQLIQPTCGTGLVTLCGTSGTDDAIYFRDTDWYEIHITETSSISFCCSAEFPLAIFLIDGSLACDGLTVLGEDTADACEEVCLSAVLGPGTYWLWVGPSGFSGVPGGSPYLMSISGYTTGEASATQEATWGIIKNLFK